MRRTFVQTSLQVDGVTLPRRLVCACWCAAQACVGCVFCSDGTFVRVVRFFQLMAGALTTYARMSAAGAETKYLRESVRASSVVARKQPSAGSDPQHDS